jgi:hypothetical protein
LCIAALLGLNETFGRRNAAEPYWRRAPEPFVDAAADIVIESDQPEQPQAG